MAKYHMTGMNSGPLNAAHVSDVIHGLILGGGGGGEKEKIFNIKNQF